MTSLVYAHPKAKPLDFFTRLFREIGEQPFITQNHYPEVLPTGTTSRSQSQGDWEIPARMYEYSPLLQLGQATSAYTTREDEEMRRLELVAQHGNDVSLLSIANLIDWNHHPPQDILQAVKLALAVEAHLLARKLALDGATLYPEHPELRKYAHILAPPKVISHNLPAKPEAGADIQWLKQHGDDYRGCWVALHSGELLAEADSFSGIIEQIGNPRGRAILVTKVR